MLYLFGSHLQLKLASLFLGQHFSLLFATTIYE